MTGPDTAIRTHGLTKRYGNTQALIDVSLEVPRGIVFGYLGPNGAGKTTTIRLLMGALRPTQGRAEVLGMDVVDHRQEVHRHVGYLPGDFVAYPSMTAREYLDYLGDLRGGVRREQVELLAKRLQLDLDRRIGALSHGNRQKVGIIQALMHEPEVLILDEPTGGLDPLMQREFLSLVREIREAGRTVFLSSHVMSEVEAIADTVAILREGHLIEVDEVADLKAKAVRRIDLTFVSEPPMGELERVRGVTDVQVIGTAVHLSVEGSTEELLRVAAPHGIENVVTHEADLEEIFLAYYTADQKGGVA